MMDFEILTRLIPLALIFCTNLAYAGTVTAKVEKLLAGPEFAQRLFIGVTGIYEKPSCAKNANFHFVLDASAPNAKMWVILLQIAYATGRSVHIEGYSTCSLWASSEDVKYIWLE